MANSLTAGEAGHDRIAVNFKQVLTPILVLASLWRSLLRVVGMANPAYFRAAG